MDIGIASIDVKKTLGSVSQVWIHTGWKQFSALHPESPVIRVEATEPRLLAGFEFLVAPSNYPLHGAKVFVREGYPDVVYLDLRFPGIDHEGKGAPTFSFEAPEDGGEDYLVDSLGVVPKVFQMSSGKNPKPTGRCPICFHPHILGADGNLKKHRENLAEWKFRKWCHQGVLQSEDRRAELYNLEWNYPEPADCGGSYLPPLEASPVGILWAIKRHRQAITSSQKSLGKHMDGSINVLYVYELGKHHDACVPGNGRYHTIIKKDNPRFDQCLKDKIKAIKDLIERHFENVQSLKSLLTWVQRNHEKGASWAPLHQLKIDIEHTVNFDLMTPLEAKALVVELMAESAPTPVQAASA
ncbi:hypothetical protein [Pseudomonas amygdali]|uniref:Uncharacterized protein n=2 Tax=Pseudomonas amygdali pv. lachrymans TaxID=53707 RepID=A0ABR5KRY2_PSEAV|nr:hypothetical protein [Pseudomonas amygdali]AXH60057.1 hypothetical protein PLA107_033065 [Pseudomonas amygdali pv. lachrymans str. M301315]KPC17462.1 Uncharacterized protein AC499_0664 [Pseudomonas amygdali pv. lachrymans]RMT05782.1 hypothetical protein ALP54_03910 [Pseudomonas amygdali pv. lachrymans]